MAKVDKLLGNWRNNPPTDVPKEKVLAVLERFFPGQWEKKKGSHIVIQDDRLIGVYDYGPAGDFDMPIKGGKKVKGVYLKKLAQTIELLKELEE